MGQSLGRRQQQREQHTGPRLSRAGQTRIIDERQQCTAATMKRCAVYPIATAAAGTEVSFAYQPEVRMDVQTHRVLCVPSALANSTDICRLYHELCSRIYAADQEGEEEEEEEEDDNDNDSGSPRRPTDVCLWIAPYVEIRMERNMNGVMQRRVVKGSRRCGRLRNRTLLVKWMLECSDWQEQLARNFWGLPKRGVGRDVTLPWFSLEVEYRPNGRRKLFDAHRHEFGARDITWEMFRHGQPGGTSITTTDEDDEGEDEDGEDEDEDEDGDNLEITPAAGTKKVAFADRKTTVEAGEIVPGSRRVTVEAGKIVFSDEGMLVVDRPGEKAVAVRGGVRKSAG